MSELEVYQRQGFGNASGFGAAPALLIVDFQIAFTDPAQYGGGNILEAVANTKRLLNAARDARIPVAFTRVVYAEHAADFNVFCRKAKGLEKFTEDLPGGQITPELAPRAEEFIVRKTQPSAFFGTMLAPWLTGKGIDTVIVTGCTTSGCVRASVVDSMSHNFRTVVARDGVGDRALAPHHANLFDMEQKYADLFTCDEIAAKLRALGSRTAA